MHVASFRWSRTVNRPDPAGEYAAATIAVAGLGMLLLVAGAAATGHSVSPLTWYLTRAAGVTLYLLLWAATVLGLGLTTTLFDRVGGRALIYSLHAYATQLAYGFLALHLITLAADPTVHFGPRELFVPFAAAWREPWTGFGVLAAELTVLIGVSFGLRRLTGFRAWRLLHWLTIPLYAMALMHAAGSGTDAGQSWAKLLYIATGAAAALLLLTRIFLGPRRPQPLQPRQPAPLDRLTRLTPARPLATEAIAESKHPAR
jgi:hypothetical protein